MILLSSRKLEQALVSGKLSSWSKVKYLMVPAVLGSLSLPLYVIRPWYGAEEPALNSLLGMICSILTVFLTYLGIKRCFLANQQIDGKAFFERFAVLLVPPMIRVMVAAISLSLVAVFGGLAVRGGSPRL